MKLIVTTSTFLYSYKIVDGLVLYSSYGFIPEVQPFEETACLHHSIYTRVVLGKIN